MLSRGQLLEGVICFLPASPGNSVHSLSDVMLQYQLFELDKIELISTRSGWVLNLEPVWVLQSSISLQNNAPSLWKLFEEKAF